MEVTPEKTFLYISYKKKTYFFRLNTLILHIPVLWAIKAWQPLWEVNIRKAVTIDHNLRLSQRTPSNGGNIFAISTDYLGQGNLSNFLQLASGECRAVSMQGCVRFILMPKTISFSEASELFSDNTTKGRSHKTSVVRWRFCQSC